MIRIKLKIVSIMMLVILLTTAVIIITINIDSDKTSRDTIIYSTPDDEDIVRINHEYMLKNAILDWDGENIKKLDVFCGTTGDAIDYANVFIVVDDAYSDVKTGHLAKLVSDSLNIDEDVVYIVAMDLDEYMSLGDKNN